MKVFISWSGQVSHSVALVLRSWLPSVIQVLQPYVSSEDIDKGARWSTDISRELEESSYGILCVTQENIDAPWLNFEAGALSKSLDRSRVSPFLFGVKRSELKGPLLQFQSTVFEKEDVRKLMHSLNSSCGTDTLEEGRLDSTFDVWWPVLEDQLSKIAAKADERPDESDDSPSAASDDILEEVLDLVRNQQKILNSPERLLPAEYLASVVETGGPRSSLEPGAIHALVSVWLGLARKLRLRDGGEIFVPEVARLVEQMAPPLLYLDRRVNGGRNERQIIMSKHRLTQLANGTVVPEATTMTSDEEDLPF